MPKRTDRNCTMRIKLPADLIAAIKVMAVEQRRGFSNMIEVSLMGACLRQVAGRSLDEEIMQEGGYGDWQEKLRSGREVRELERLFKLGE